MSVTVLAYALVYPSFAADPEPVTRYVEQARESYEGTVTMRERQIDQLIKESRKKRSKAYGLAVRNARDELKKVEGA